jgi:hypothetical protein
MEIMFHFADNQSKFPSQKGMLVSFNVYIRLLLKDTDCLIVGKSLEMGVVIRRMNIPRTSFSSPKKKELTFFFSFETR